MRFEIKNIHLDFNIAVKSIILMTIVFGSLKFVLPTLLFCLCIILYSGRVFYFSKEARLLTMIAGLGCLSSILRFSDFYGMYVFYRDVFYYFQPVVYLWFGGLVALSSTKSKEFWFSFLVLAIFLYSVYSWSPLLDDPSIIFSLSYRSEVRLGSHVSVIGLALIYYAYKYDVKVTKNRYYTISFVVVLLLSVLITFSRTNLLTLALIFSVPVLIRLRIQRLVFALLVVNVIFVLFAGQFIPIQGVENENSDFIVKISQSISEMTIRKINDISDMKSSWRAYEAFLGLEAYSSGSWLQYLAGQGLGVIVETPHYVFDEKHILDILPIYHNAFVNILLKTGFFGIILYFIFIFRLLDVKSNINNANSSFYVAIIIYSGLVIYCDTLVIHGLYKANVNVVLLFSLGFSILKLKLAHDDDAIKS